MSLGVLRWVSISLWFLLTDENPGSSKTEAWGLVKDQDALASHFANNTQQRVHSLQHRAHQEDTDTACISGKWSVTTFLSQSSFTYSWLWDNSSGADLLIGVRRAYSALFFICSWSIPVLKGGCKVALSFFICFAFVLFIPSSALCSHVPPREFLFFVCVWLVISERKTRSCSKFLIVKRSKPERKYWRLQENFVY